MTNDPATRCAANIKWLFADLPLERRFDAVAAEGFRGVEVPNPYSLSPSRIRTLVQDAGLVPVLVNTPVGEPGTVTGGGMACLPDHVDDFQDGVRRGLEYAQEIGCRLLHVVGGRRPAGLSRDRALAQYVRNLAWAADQARMTPVRLVIEMQNQRSAPGFVLRSQSEAAAVVDAVGGPVGMLFDAFHTQVAEGDVTTTFSRHLPIIDHVQIGDAPERTEPGTGELSWRFVFDHIRRSTYGGWVGFEFKPSGPSEGVLSRVAEVI